MFGKKRDKSKILENEIEKIEIIEKPKICLFDFNSTVVSKLKEKGFNIVEGTLGRKVEVPNTKDTKSHYCCPNFHIPRNLHECDIIVIDMASTETVSYEHEKHFKHKEKNHYSHYCLSEFPQKIFDPIPYAAAVLQPKIEEHLTKESFLIVFASAYRDFEYRIVRVGKNELSLEKKFVGDNYRFLIRSYHSIQRIGKEIKILKNAGPLRNILEKNIDDFHYEIAFQHPYSWNDKGEEVKDINFIPLIVNNLEEIVSFAQKEKDAFVYVLPQCQKKENVLIPMFESILPDLTPKVFPFSTQFIWKDKEPYWLPNQEALMTKKESIIEEYERKIIEIESEINANEKEYAFLHELITETGDTLVLSVQKYFEWLGFEKIRNMDHENNGIREEDLQIELDNGLLVVEIKGIGGTSKDNECNQIHEIKFRRSRERGSFDVKALYIVNHQRYLPPEDRENPPFSEAQIKDAENDERGLLTTWELFKLYKYIQEAIITKEEARSALLKFGLVEFVPSNILLIGTVQEVFKKGLVIVLKIDDCELKIGDRLYVNYKNKYYCVKIESIMLNDRSIDRATNGEVGIKVSREIKKGSKVYRKICINGD